MTALLTLEHADARRRLSAASSYRAGADRVADRAAAPASACRVRDLLRGAAARRARNDAATTLAVGVAGLAQGVRARDEPARAASSGCATRTSRTRSGSTRPATTPPPPTSRSSRSSCAATRSSRETMDRRARDAADRRAPAHVRQPQHARPAVPWVNGVKTGHTTRAGYCSSARRRATASRSSASCSATPARRPATRTRSRSCATASAATTRRPAVREGRGPRAGRKLALPRRATSTLVAARTVRRSSRARRAAHASRSSGRPPSSSGRCPPGARIGTIVVRQRGRVVARVPLVTARAVAAPRRRSAARATAHGSP